MTELGVVHPPCHGPQASTRAEWGRLVRPSSFPHFLKQCPTPEGPAWWVERSQAFTAHGIDPRGKKGEPQTPRNSLISQSLSHLTIEGNVFLGCNPLPQTPPQVESNYPCIILACWASSPSLTCSAFLCTAISQSTKAELGLCGTKKGLFWVPSPYFKFCNKNILPPRHKESEFGFLDMNGKRTIPICFMLPAELGIKCKYPNNVFCFSC